MCHVLFIYVNAVFHYYCRISLLMDFPKIFLHFNPQKPIHTLGTAFFTQCPSECKPITKTPTASLAMNKDIKDLSDSMETVEITGNQTIGTLKHIFVDRVFLFTSIIIQKPISKYPVRAILPSRALAFRTYNSRHYNPLNDSNEHLTTEEVKEEEARPATPTEGDPSARAPTPNPPNPASPSTQETTHPTSELTLPVPLVRRERLDSGCSGASSRSCPKDKGERAPLSELARRAKRAKESNSRRDRRRKAAEAKRNMDPASKPGEEKTREGPPPHSVNTGNPPTTNQPTTNPPTNPSTNTATTPSLRTPAEVYGTVNPRVTVHVTGAGDEEGIRRRTIRALLFAPENYSVGQLFTNAGGVSFGVEDDNSVRVVTETLEGAGLTVNIQPIWNRYTFHVPQHYDFLTLEEITEALSQRNGRTVRGPEGLPDNSLRGISVLEEGGEGGSNLPRRVRVWVDVSPEAEQYLAANDYLLRIVDSAVRLRPATNSRSAPDRS